MSKSSRAVLRLSETCLLVMGASVCVTLAGEPADVQPDAFADSLRFSSLRTELLSATLNTDDVKLDHGILIAQAGRAGGAAGFFVLANNASVTVGVSQEFSTWSDLTAMFRPSRWANPLREGGALSWMNYNAWANVPGRTAKVLLGEAIVIGTTYAILDSGGSNDGGGTSTSAETTTPVPAVGSSSSGHSSDESPSVTTAASTTGGGGSGGGSVAPPPLVPPPAVGGEMPF